MTDAWSTSMASASRRRSLLWVPRFVAVQSRWTRLSIVGDRRRRQIRNAVLGGDRVVTPTRQCANAKPAQRTEYVRDLPIRRPANFPDPSVECDISSHGLPAYRGGRSRQSSNGARALRLLPSG